MTMIMPLYLFDTTLPVVFQVVTANAVLTALQICLTAANKNSASCSPTPPLCNCKINLDVGVVCLSHDRAPHARSSSAKLVESFCAIVNTALNGIALTCLPVWGCSVRNPIPLTPGPLHQGTTLFIFSGINTGNLEIRKQTQKNEVPKCKIHTDELHNLTK